MNIISFGPVFATGPFFLPTNRMHFIRRKNHLKQKFISN